MLVLQQRKRVALFCSGYRTHSLFTCQVCFVIINFGTFLASKCWMSVTESTFKESHGHSRQITKAILRYIGSLLLMCAILGNKLDQHSSTRITLCVRMITVFPYLQAIQLHDNNPRNNKDQTAKMLFSLGKKIFKIGKMGYQEVGVENSYVTERPIVSGTRH